MVPTNTFFATPAAVQHAGGIVRFAECDPATYAIDVDHARSLIGPNTRAVVAVHIGGVITPRIGELQAACGRAGIPLVEDAAHAHGSTLDGKPAGSFGLAAAFSFYPTKVITSGEGGMIATSDARINEEARIYRDQGKAGFTSNFHTRLGNNWRMSEPHAVIGCYQLKRLPEFIAARRRIAAIYDRALPAIGVKPLTVPGAVVSNYYKYIAMPPAGVERDAESVGGHARSQLQRAVAFGYQVLFAGAIFAHDDGQRGQQDHAHGEHERHPRGVVAVPEQAQVHERPRGGGGVDGADAAAARREGDQADDVSARAVARFRTQHGDDHEAHLVVRPTRDCYTTIGVCLTRESRLQPASLPGTRAPVHARP